MLKWVAKRLKHVWLNADEATDIYKPLSKRGTHARIKHVWYAAVQTNITSPIKHSKKEMFYVFDRMFDGLQILSNTTKYDQTQSNTIKQHQIRCPNGKMFSHHWNNV